MSTGVTEETDALVGTGIEGLDEILLGGLATNYLYVVEGDPGAGKTTLAMQFLLAGVERGERTVFVTLSEDERELRASAASHGWSLDDIDILQMFPAEDGLGRETSYTMFHPAEVELGETMRTIRDHLDRVRPSRVVVDSVSELRLLADSALRYRRQLLSLRQYFTSRGITVVFTDDRTGIEHDKHLRSLAHGVVSLKVDLPDYGPLRRQIQIRKMRARPFREGTHDILIRTGGLEVFPRLIAAEHSGEISDEVVGSGSESLDTLLGGGLSRGTSTLLVGTTGTGKSSLATQLVHAAAQRGEAVAAFLFDEGIATFMGRAAGLGLDLRGFVEDGQVTVRGIDPAELTPGQFAVSVRRAVEEDGVRMVVIDSLSGYLSAMPSERYLTLHLHELFSYLGQKGVITVLVQTQHGIFGRDGRDDIQPSYLADGVLLLRHFETGGRLRRAISVVKKRSGPHERSVHALRFEGGIHIGEPLVELEGVLSGVPRSLTPSAAGSGD